MQRTISKQNKITNWNLVGKLLTNPFHFVFPLSYSSDKHTPVITSHSEYTTLSLPQFLLFLNQWKTPVCQKFVRDGIKWNDHKSGQSTEMKLSRNDATKLS